MIRLVGYLAVVGAQWAFGRASTKLSARDHLAVGMAICVAIQAGTFL